MGLWGAEGSDTMRKHRITRPLLVGLISVLAAACGKKEDKQAAPPPSASAPAPTAGQANVDAKLLELLQAASKSCEETAANVRPNCNSPEKNALVSSFNRGERSRVKALPTFAHTLASGDPNLQGLAAGVLYAAFRTNLGPEGKPGSVAPDDARALMKAALALPDALAMPAMPAVTHAMMLTRQGPALLEALTPEKAVQVRSMAYRFLMVYGRLAVFDQIKALAKDPESAIVLAALESPRNMQSWSAEEQAVICPWAESFIDDPRSPVAGNAMALLSNCSGPQLDRLIERIEKSVTDKHYSFVHATALREMCREGRLTGSGASDEQCQRARALAEKVVKNTQMPGRVRALTLNGLGSRWPDKQMQKLVKQLKLDAAPEVKQAAERLERRIDEQQKREAERSARKSAPAKSQ